MRAAEFRAALVPVALLLASAAPVPADLGWLSGSWRGEGRFMGRASTATLTAAPALDGRFLEIAWRVETSGDAPLRYQGRGLYRLAGAGWEGHWYDSSGAIRPLTAAGGPGAFEVRWGTAESERGKSRYTLEGATLHVEDSVEGATGSRVFASHELRRSD